MSKFESRKEEFLAELATLMNIRRDQLGDDLELKDDNWDSVAALSAIALIDQQFGITVPSDALLGCRSTGALLAMVKDAVDRAEATRA